MKLGIPIPLFLFRFMPRRTKRKIANEVLLPALLSPPHKDEFLSKALEFIEQNYDPKSGQDYKNTEEEIRELLEVFPALTPYKIYLLHTVGNCRIKYELPV